MTTKTCTKCGEEKPPEEFYRNRAGKDGLRPDCKTCHLATTSRYDRSPRGLLKERLRQSRDRIKVRCRAKTKALINAKKLIRATVCEKCGSPRNIEAHHPDYSQPSLVQWLCRQCHRDLHRPVSRLATQSNPQT